MPLGVPPASPSDDLLVVRLSDLRRVSRGSERNEVGPQRQRTLRALRDFLNSAAIGPDTELTLQRHGREIVVTVLDEERDKQAAAATGSEPASFEACLADVLARRDSALKRLAE